MERVLLVALADVLEILIVTLLLEVLAKVVILLVALDALKVAKTNVHPVAQIHVKQTAALDALEIALENVLKDVLAIARDSVLRCAVDVSLLVKEVVPMIAMAIAVRIVLVTALEVAVKDIVHLDALEDVLAVLAHAQENVLIVVIVTAETFVMMLVSVGVKMVALAAI